MVWFGPERLIRLPQAVELEASPDGEWLLTTVEEVTPDGNGMETSLWELPTRDGLVARLVLSHAVGHVRARYADSGQLALIARATFRDGGTHGPPALWLLDLASGDTRLIAKTSGGVDGVAITQRGTMVASVGVHRHAQSVGDDERLDQAWRDRGASGMRFDRYPIARLDRYLAPYERHLYLVDPLDGGFVRDLTPSPGLTLVDSSFDVAADGTWLVVARNHTDGVRNLIERVDIATGERVRLTRDAARYSQLRASPDGRRIACVRENISASRPPSVILLVLDAQTGRTEASTSVLDAWPTGPVWSPDGDSLLFLAPIDGVVMPHRLTVSTGEIARIPATQSVESLTLAGPGRRTPYGLASSLVSPPRPVALAASGNLLPRVMPTWSKLRKTGPRCVLERIVTTSRDGAPVNSWLVRKAGATGRRPLLVLLHGGPFGAWTYWRRRLNAPLLADAGYTLLLPEPAPSVGYGQDHVRRGWRAWTTKPVEDVLAAIEACLDRDDVDSDRIALVGVSFGGYLASWIASVMPGRFRGLVVHAGIWDLRSFHATTDLTTEWSRYLADPAGTAAQHERMSPRRNARQLRLPILLTHGVRDLRVPVSQAVHAYSDLWRYADGCELLLFPDEGHTIRRPQNLSHWYREVVSFLDHHVARSASPTGDNPSP